MLMISTYVVEAHDPPWGRFAGTRACRGSRIAPCRAKLFGAPIHERGARLALPLSFPRAPPAPNPHIGPLSKASRNKFRVTNKALAKARGTEEGGGDSRVLRGFVVDSEQKLSCSDRDQEHRVHSGAVIHHELAHVPLGSKYDGIVPRVAAGNAWGVPVAVDARWPSRSSTMLRQRKDVAQRRPAQEEVQDASPRGLGVLPRLQDRVRQVLGSATNRAQLAFRSNISICL